ncbi:MAG: DUF502 domain-containing protein [Isosphaeraceae bacterium]
MTGSTSPEPSTKHLARPTDTIERPVGFFRSSIQLIRSRIISGLVAALPVALTFFIVSWLYNLLTTLVLRPAIDAVRYFLDLRGLTQTVLYTYLTPFLAAVLVLSLLYLLGVFVRYRLLMVVDWVMLRVPIVNTIFKAVNNVVQSLGQQLQGNHGFKRVVLVEFPHPGMKSLAFVTRTLSDATTGQTILCVCVLTGVMPPSGFTLFVPEERVTDIDWSMNQTLQAILSGGITTPSTIHYAHGLNVPPGGPLIDPQGHPLDASLTPSKPVH